jgi:hypothetical protein
MEAVGCISGSWQQMLQQNANEPNQWHTPTATNWQSIHPPDTG